MARTEEGAGDLAEIMFLGECAPAEARRAGTDAWRRLHRRPGSTRLTVTPAAPVLSVTMPRTRERSSRRSHTAATRRRSASGAGDEPPGEPSLADALRFVEASPDGPRVVRATYTQAGQRVEAWASPTGFVCDVAYADGGRASMATWDAITSDLPGRLAAIEQDGMRRYVERFTAALGADAIGPDDFRGVGS